MTSWKDNLTFLDPKGVTRTICGKDYEILPCSTKLGFELKVLAEPITRALAAMTTPTNNDIEVKHVSVGRGEDTETHTMPISAELAAFRSKQRIESLKPLMDLIKGDEVQTLVGKILVDALRKNWTKTQAPTPDEFLAELPLPVMTELLMAVADANKGVFGPWGKDFMEAMKTIGSRVRTLAQETASVPASEEASNDLSSNQNQNTFGEMPKTSSPPA